MNVFKNIYNYRELLKNNVKKEIRGKYKKSVLGVLWTFLNPLLQLAVYAFIFPLILKNAQEYYIIFVCAGLIPWTFFTTAVAQSTWTVVGNANIVKKVYFPREILPISVVTSAMVNFLISTIIIVAFCLGYGLGISKYIIFYPIILVIQYILQLGIAFILSAATVYFRDLEHFVQIILMLMFYATPIVYSSESIPDAFKAIIIFNPMAHIIEGYRDIFYNQVKPDFMALGIVCIVSIILCVIGYLIFRKLQKGFAEEL
ncbi:MAG: ABC transporter permease [Clostridia bacterium]|nr:ABC transporter permease [Clostridia bacterium]